MKKIFLPFTLCVLAACNSGNGDNKSGFPKPGTVVASAETPVVGDTLNHGTFSVKVVADSNVQLGIYDVEVQFGHNPAHGQFTMPKGGEHLKPSIRKEATPNSFIIGFTVGKDTTFYDYFQVSCNSQITKLQYVKTYTF